MSELPHTRTWWKELGFQRFPERKVANGAFLVYRCWGERMSGLGSTEWGTGFFSLEKSISVLDAELRANIVNYNNGIHFVSTFRVNRGVVYWQGPVAHEPKDLSRPANQIYIEPKPSLQVKLTLQKSREVLRHDAFVSARNGSA